MSGMLHPKKHDIQYVDIGIYLCRATINALKLETNSDCRRGLKGNKLDAKQFALRPSSLQYYCARAIKLVNNLLWKKMLC